MPSDYQKLCPAAARKCWLHQVCCIAKTLHYLALASVEKLQCLLQKQAFVALLVSESFAQTEAVTAHSAVHQMHQREQASQAIVADC